MQTAFNSFRLKLPTGSPKESFGVTPVTVNMTLWWDNLAECGWIGETITHRTRPPKPRRSLLYRALAAVQSHCWFFATQDFLCFFQRLDTSGPVRGATIRIQNASLPIRDMHSLHPTGCLPTAPDFSIPCEPSSARSTTAPPPALLCTFRASTPLESRSPQILRLPAGTICCRRCPETIPGALR